MGYLIVSILASVGVTLLLKAATNFGMPVQILNFFYRLGMGTFAVVGLLISFRLAEFPALWLRTWMFVIPGILCLYLAGMGAMSGAKYGHIGITTMVIRSSLILPVGYALTVIFFENREKFFHVLPWAGAGCVAILMGFVMIGAERETRRHVASPGKWIGWLGLGFLFQGGWDTLVAIASGLSGREMQFCFFLVSLGAALLSSFKLEVQLGHWSWWQAGGGLLAGLLSLIVALARPLAVKDLGALIVFPAFSIGGLLLVQFCGALFFKHALGRLGWVGVSLSAIGIILLVFARQ